MIICTEEHMAVFPDKDITYAELCRTSAEWTVNLYYRDNQGDARMVSIDLLSTDKYFDDICGELKRWELSTRAAHKCQMTPAPPPKSAPDFDYFGMEENKMPPFPQKTEGSVT